MTVFVQYCHLQCVHNHNLVITNFRPDLNLTQVHDQYHCLVTFRTITNSHLWHSARGGGEGVLIWNGGMVACCVRGALLAANAKGALDLAKMQEATEQLKHQETIKVGD